MKFPRKCQYLEYSRVVSDGNHGDHQYNSHYVNHAFNNHLQWRNWKVRYSARKAVSKFVTEISYHKDCDHEKTPKYETRENSTSAAGTEGEASYSESRSKNFFVHLNVRKKRNQFIRSRKLRQARNMTTKRIWRNY